ncbi:MAG: glycosyltransferase [Lachnospiraceae bacterium]|nr:glycosyltransferase [Lachnospiraceae bacterium]
MKITHLCLKGTITDGWSYQENLLIKSHIKLGYAVSVITSQWVYDENAHLYKFPKTEYITDQGAQIYRLPIANKDNLDYKFKRYSNVIETLEKCSPDILFIHGNQFLDIDKIVKYLKNTRKVKVFVDNHSDFSNSATNWLSKNILHKCLWKRTAHMIEPYTTKFYGVLPARVDFLVDMYHLPKNKCELLVMGADDEYVEKYKSPTTRDKIRKSFGIKKDDFLVVTGGKIDSSKRQTLILMETVKTSPDSRLKLLVFGSIQDDLKQKVLDMCDGEKIQYLGWANEDQSYKYFSLADIVVFPGRHSVYWEQVAGQGIPMVCKYWEGTTHVNIYDNVIFLYEDTVDAISEVFEKLLKNVDALNNMKEAAQKAMKVFSYDEIAKKSIL